MRGATDAPAVAPARLVRAWLAVAGWVLLVWALAGDDFAAPATEGWLGRWLRAWFAGISAEVVAAANFALRKGAHAAEYAVLGLLAFRAVRLGAAGPPGRQAGLALLVALAVAIVDETGQALRPLRGGSPWDVSLDLAGAAAAVTLAARSTATRWGARAFPAGGAR